MVMNKFEIKNDKIRLENICDGKMTVTILVRYQIVPNTDFYGEYTKGSHVEIYDTEVVEIEGTPVPVYGGGQPLEIGVDITLETDEYTDMIEDMIMSGDVI